MKKFNKILSLLVVFAMALTMLPTSALAVVNEYTAETDSKYVEGMPAGDRDLMNSLRENYPQQAGTVVSGDASVTATEIKDPSVSLEMGNMQDLLITTYAQTDIVRVIVVLEGAPLLDQGFSTAEISANEDEVQYQVSVMHTMQDTLMADINVLIQDLMPDTYTGKIEAKYNYSVTMNGVAVEVPYGIVDEIAELNGVEAAYVAPQYSVPEDMTSDATPNMVTTQLLAGSALTWDAGYTGAGMRIAIIDTGLDIDHPSFVDDVPLTDTSLTLAEIESVLTNLNAYKRYAGLTASALYNSVKIPYRFNYVDHDLDVTHDNDSAGDHGTHVAGIAAANKIDSTEVVGVAPEAQLLAMKVFGKNGGAYWDDIVAALEDCYWLNVDAVNMSLGSPSGFTYESDDLSEQFVAIMARVEESDMIASVSAGNSYSAGCSNYWYELLVGAGLASYFPELVPGHNQTIDPANGVVSSPATFIGATVVASLENNTTAAEVMVATDGVREHTFFFGDNYTYFTYYLGGYGDYQNHEYEYVVVPGYGDKSDYDDIDVEGKVALVERGELAFTDKQTNAANAGAVGIIVYDNGNSGSIFYMQDAGLIPNVTVTRADGLELIDLAGDDGIGTLIVRYNNVVIAENELAGTMSDFSSWGVTPDLRLVPDVTSYGGNIYSTYTDGEYGIMSGTSMSAPHIAGMAALVLQYLRGSDYEVLASDGDYHLVAEALLMSTAEPVVEASGVLYSPRKQGAGNANIYNAVSSPVYLTANGGEPSVSFGDDDDRTGVYSFNFELNNLTDASRTYVLDGIALTDQFHEAFYKMTGVKLMGETSRELDAEIKFYLNNADAETFVDYNGDGFMNLKDVQNFLDDVNAGIHNSKFDLNEDGKIDTADVQALYELAVNASTTEIERVVVPANGTVIVSVTIELTADDMAYMDENYPNGIFVDGFVRAYSVEENGIDLSLPFMGFYGDWSAARVFDTYSWYHEGMELPERYASILWVDSTNGVGAGGNPYEASLVKYDPNYEPEIYGAVVSPNGDGVNDYIDDIYLSLMRNAKLIQFNWYDEDGNLLDQYDAEYARQSSYQSGYGSIIPFVYSWWFTDIYDFTDAEGNYLPNGSEVTLSIDFYLDDGDWEVDDNTSAVITVDSVYPELSNIEYNYDETTNTRELVITVADDCDVAAVALLTRMGSIVSMIKPTEKNATVNADGSFEIVFDVTEMDDEFILVVGDYGGNEIYYNIAFTDGTNHVRQNAFYGYRNLMNYVPGNGYIYLMDSYNGWHSFAVDSAEDMLMHTSMYADNETLVDAAEYVDGYIIAIDENGAIFAMKAGDWTRIPVGNFTLGYYGEYTDNLALDMAYDFANNVLYVLTDESYVGAGGHLFTIDLLTGEVADLGTITMPEGHTGQLLTLACDNDGVLYSISYVAGAAAGNTDAGDLYIIDLANATTIEPDYWWQDPVTNIPVTYVGETGYIPEYRQSMTVDHDTNELYWMAYASPYATDPATFFHVDKATGELTAISDVEYESWMTAIFKPYLDSGDIFPDAELEVINLDKTSIPMSVGATAALTATPYPYYASLGELVWTSSDETVAIVVDGVIKGVGEGRAEITVTSGEITATCLVDIVNLQEDITFYEWGNDAVWMSLNATAPGDAIILEDAIAPSSPYNGFMAAAYFDGWLYMSESTGSFYRVDPETMQGTLLGSSYTTLFAMAFNYADGFMYALEQNQISMWDISYNLVRVNLNNGAIEVVAEITAVTPLAMAIDHDGNIFVLGIDTMSYSLCLAYGAVYDGQFCWNGMTYAAIDTIYNYTSMVYSAMDNGLYVSDNAGQLLWIDLESLTSEDGLRVVNVGTIGSLESAMNMSMFVIPETEPEVPDVAVTSVSLADSFMLLVGGTTSVSASIEPWNAYPEITYAIADQSIATVDENGVITGVGSGTTTLTVKVQGITETFESTITVAEPTGYINGYLLDDFSGGGYVFARFSDTDPVNDIQAFYGDDTFSVFSGAYFNGKLYAYGQDQWGDLGYYYYFFTIDPNTLEMTEIARVAYNLRDMAFDYTTGNLYAIAQGGTLVGAVVQMDMETGELIVIAETGIKIAAMTVDAEGQMYGIGEDDYLYAINKYTGELTQIGHTGVDAAALYQSMHYDMDTGNVYWAQVAADQTSSLRLVDLETGVTCSIGTISPTGAMMTMMYTVPANEPTEPKGDATEAGIVITDRATTYVGGTVQLDATILAEVELQVPGATATTNGVASTDGMTITWTTSDASVATVDANGLVTGVGAGTANITAKVGAYEATCVVTITEEARKYYAYDKSNNQWISFDGETLDSHGNLAVNVERVDAEDESALQASYYVQETDTVYAIDEFGTVYSINPDTFVRENIVAELGTTYSTTITEYDYWMDEYYTYDAECEMGIVDMAYENGKLYVAMYSEDNYLAVIAEVNLETSEITYLFESSEVKPANLYVSGGRAFMVDSWFSGMICNVDLYSAEQTVVQEVLIKLYWGDPWSGCALFEDALTGVIYTIRDMTDTNGTYVYDWTTYTSTYYPWDGVTGDSVLYILGLSDGSLVSIGEIGDNIVVRGMFIR